MGKDKITTNTGKVVTKKYVLTKIFCDYAQKARKYLPTKASSNE